MFTDWQADNAQIQLARLNQLQQLLGHVLVNKYLDFRKSFSEGVQNMCQKIGCNRWQNSEDHLAGMVSVGTSDFPFGNFDLRQNLLCLPDENQARFRRHNPPVISVQEKFSHPDFQLLNLHAQSRLGDVAARGGFAKTSLLDHSHKISHLSYVHVPGSLFIENCNPLRKIKGSSETIAFAYKTYRQTQFQIFRRLCY